MKHVEKEKWKFVDAYLDEQLHKKNSILEAVLANNRKNDLPAIDVSRTQGEFLRLLVTMTGAKRILEIGTLGGYSTICMAKALPEDGRIITLEANSIHAACAEENIRNARFEDRISIRVGEALKTLPELEKQKESFDFIFIDADKPNNPQYLEWALKLAKPGATILADNVVRAGEVINDHSTDPRVHGIRTFLERLANEERIDSTAIQTVGEKGYDGFVIGVVRK
ncbi:O-methyltransferase [Bacillus sp. JCM 19041]|uniref:O-methyltransferase n=1 Tax=Bacillus sp. JCM 19041 TaxID=1460637 RepID=UPI0006D1C610